MYKFHNELLEQVDYYELKSENRSYCSKKFDLNCELSVIFKFSNL